MGSITEAQALAALEVAYAAFDLPRVKFTVNPRKRNFSHYKLGAMMVAPNGGVARPLSVPTIEMAPSMMNWRTVLHELAHHVHTVAYHKAAMALAETKNVPLPDRLARRAFAKTFLKREHFHGHRHRVLMQKLVDFFVANGSITVLPTYMKKPVSALTQAFVEYRAVA